AVAAAQGRSLRRQPQPPPALLPVPGRAETLARRYPGSLPRIPARAGIRPEAARRALRRGRLGIAHARRLGTGLGGMARRHGDHPVHLLPAGRRAGLQAGPRRDHLRTGAPRDVPSGEGQRVRPGVDHGHQLRRRLPSERGRAIEIQLRGERRGVAAPAVQRLRVAGEAPDRGRAAAAGVRDGAQVLAYLQPARRARRDLGHRARRLHRPRARARAPRRAGVLRLAREARVSDGEDVSEGTLLVELLTEELPPKSLRQLSEVFADEVTSEIIKHRLKDVRDPKTAAFATLRRLAVVIENVRASGLDSENPVDGPASANAKAVEGFARKHGVSVDALQRRQTPKGEIVVANVKLPGVKLEAVLADIVEKALKKLPIPKVMRWGSSEARFVRPVHTLVMMHGTKIVPGAVLGLKSGNKTRGHRFMGKPEISLASAQGYEKQLL